MNIHDFCHNVSLVLQFCIAVYNESKQRNKFQLTRRTHAGINASLGGDNVQMQSESIPLVNASSHAPSSNETRRRLLEEREKEKATVENDDSNVLEDEADSSFDVFRSAEEIAEEHGDQGLSDHYSYDYDDYVDESMWADDSWSEAQHLKEADFIDIDAHILCTPVRNLLHASTKGHQSGFPLGNSPS